MGKREKGRGTGTEPPMAAAPPLGKLLHPVSLPQHLLHPEPPPTPTSPRPKTGPAASTPPGQRRHSQRYSSTSSSLTPSRPPEPPPSPTTTQNHGPASTALPDRDFEEKRGWRDEPGPPRWAHAAPPPACHRGRPVRLCPLASQGNARIRESKQINRRKQIGRRRAGSREERRTTSTRRKKNGRPHR
jgi:hypothetical protein